MIIRRAINILRRRGLLYFVKRIAELIRRASYTKSEMLFYVDLDDPEREPVILPESVVLGHADTYAGVPEEVLDQAYRQKTKAIVDHYMRHFFARGSTFWFLMDNKKVVGVCWSTVNRNGLFYFSPLAVNEGTIEATEVYPEFRGKGYNPLMIQAVFDELSKNGVRRIYMSSKLWNTPSLRSLAKTGLKEVGKVRRFQILGKRISIWAK